MKHRVAFIVCAVLVAGLLVGCGGRLDSGHVGPVGPQGAAGPQPVEGSPPPNLTVIEDTDAMVTEEYAFSGFSQLEISGGFDVTIKRGEGFRVKTRFEETAVPYIQMEQVGDRLKIGLEEGRTYNMVNITLEVEIRMPALSRLVLEGGSDATVTGFGDDFEAEVDFLSELRRE